MRLRIRPMVLMVAALLAHGAALPVLAPAQTAPTSVQERVDLEVVERIREEGLNRSRIEDLARYLNDVIGPRLTGSTGMRRANEWAAETFRGWGLTNVTIEPWGEFGRGWERVSYTGRVVEPFVQPLHAQPLAWSGSTNGAQSGPVLAIEAVTPADLAQYRGRLRGAWILAQRHVPHAPEFDEFTRRFDADDLLYPQPPPPPPAAQQQQAQQQQFAQPGPSVAAVLDSMARAEGALGYLRPSQWPYGILRVGGVNRNDPDPLPALVVSHDQYGQLWRNAVAGVPARVELNVQNRFLTDDLQGYNTLADLPGTDLRDQIVMIGAHLDSWHTGTGATDNAAGSVIMMEAMRILRTLGLQPRRTIRIGLWSGEEQGLLGSRFYVQNHPDLHDRISVYLNVDNGTGRLRGIWNQSNPAATPIFEQLLWPFRDIGIVAVRQGNTGGTDHLSFDRAGIPGFNFIQDPIEYSFRTHHSSADTFDRLVLDDLRQAAVIVAATAYHLAMRDEMFPRK
ncbi:MAG TPA: M20/M25/M40 family metallo-hydrolase [Longimicrobiales bacterium]|nr:M20/M25/M40 family metallo-hydrolase [Longimicrobiales bacterium]